MMIGWWISEDLIRKQGTFKFLKQSELKTGKWLHGTESQTGQRNMTDLTMKTFPFKSQGPMV